MAKFVSLILCAIALLPTLDATVSKPKPKGTIVLNTRHNAKGLPLNFRKMTDPFPNRKVAAPSRFGLGRLNASGSGQFSTDGLAKLVAHLGSKKKLIIVDLRQESHGFLNKAAISWFTKHDLANKGKSLLQVRTIEKKLLQGLAKNKKVKVHKRSSKIVVKEALSEEMLSNRHRVGYFRIASQDNTRPSNGNVNRFVAFIKRRPANTWLHMHCQQGQGRTTTYLAMLDIMYNAKKVSLQDIVMRQKHLGGLDLFYKPAKSVWHYAGTMARRHFIKNFYKYCQEEGPQFNTRWQDWCNAQKQKKIKR